MFSCRGLKKLIPTKKATELLKEGARALERNDFDAANKAYEKIPLEERDCKPIKGFFASIDNKRKTQAYSNKIEKEYIKNKFS